MQIILTDRRNYFEKRLRQLRADQSGSFLLPGPGGLFRRKVVNVSILWAFGADFLSLHELIESFWVGPFLKGLKGGITGLFHPKIRSWDQVGAMRGYWAGSK